MKRVPKWTDSWKGNSDGHCRIVYIDWTSKKPSGVCRGWTRYGSTRHTSSTVLQPWSTSTGGTSSVTHRKGWRVCLRRRLEQPVIFSWIEQPRWLLVSLNIPTRLTGLWEKADGIVILLLTYACVKGKKFRQRWHGLGLCVCIKSKTCLGQVELLPCHAIASWRSGLQHQNISRSFTRIRSLLSQSLITLVKCFPSKLSKGRSQHANPVNILDYDNIWGQSRQLQRVVHQVDQASSDQIQPPVGIMTSEHRDTWAKVKVKQKGVSI